MATTHTVTIHHHVSVNVERLDVGGTFGVRIYDHDQASWTLLLMPDSESANAVSDALRDAVAKHAPELTEDEMAAAFGRE